MKPRRSGWRVVGMVVLTLFAVVFGCTGSCFLLMAPGAVRGEAISAILVGIVGVVLCALLIYWAIKLAK
jgi:hypothetical protein